VDASGDVPYDLFAPAKNPLRKILVRTPDFQVMYHTVVSMNKLCKVVEGGEAAT